MTLADVLRPEIDLATAELVIPEPAERLGQLGGLFARVPAFGLGCYSDAELADLMARTLRR